MSSLTSMTPQKAVIAETGERVDVNDVKINTILAVKAGDAIPLDGIVVEGKCEVDEKMLTGESLPVIKELDSVLWAGTINCKNYCVGKRHMVARMSKHVEEASSRKSQTQRFIDNFAQSNIFLQVAVGLISAGIAVVPAALKVHDIKPWFHLVIVVLLIACPCALILSTPIAIFCALTKAAISGLLLKGGDYIETLSGIKTVAFDKTGTITRGEFTVTDFSVVDDISIKTLLYWVSSIQSKSSHPMAAALVEYGMSNSIKPIPKNVENFENLPGEGVLGTIDGKDICIGNRRIVFSLVDTCRAGALEAIEELKLLGVRSVMLTGDRSQDAIASPSEKAVIIENFKKDGLIAMIGDGINDAPALVKKALSLSGEVTKINVTQLPKTNKLTVPKSVNQVDGGRRPLFRPDKQFVALTSMDRFLNEMEREKPIGFTVEQLRIATDNYSLLGLGGSGAVYKGSFSDGTSIAVKVLRGSSEKRIIEQFMAEVATIGKVHHFNLVHLHGFCFESHFRGLVYEYMANDTLEKYLFCKSMFLSFEKHHEIAVGTPRGIAYLHEECQQRIIYYDIKPGNILLDRNFCPKVADFGLAKLCNRDNAHITLTRGTPGFAAPELWMPNFPVTHKCDVYSFGMLLFEIIGRRRNHNINLPESQVWFPMWVWKRFDAEQVRDLITACGIEGQNCEIAERFVRVALSCVQYRLESRPIMSVVVKMLGGSIEVPKPMNPFPHLVDWSSPTHLVQASQINADKSICFDSSVMLTKSVHVITTPILTKYEIYLKKFQ
ncbi:hypothetical protein JHK87_042428 [Glycine soja]|nr:hypothetical protein JHK87_042428 [Glycine soja]